MRNLIKYAFLLILLTGWNQQVLAQKSKTTKTATPSPTPNSDVDKKFQPTLEPVERILTLPAVENPNIVKQSVEYQLSESPTSLKSDYTPLPAAGIASLFPSSDQLGYFRLGVGNHRSFLGDLQLNLVRKPTHSVDVNFRHRSIFGDLLLQTGEVNQANFADNDMQIHYKTVFGKTIMDASLSEHALFWNNYGKRNAFGMDSLNMPKGQWSTDGQYRFALTSIDLGNPLSWSVKSNGHLFRVGRGISSNTLIPANPKGGTETEFKLEALVDYEVNDQLLMGVSTQIRNFGYKTPSTFAIGELDQNIQRDLSNEFANRGYFELAPAVQYYLKNWKLTAGIKLAIPSLVTESVRSNIVASATTPLNKKLVFRAKLDGGVTPSSYREGMGLNPFIDPSIRLKSSWKLYDLLLSLDYRPLSTLKISPKFGANTTHDAPFFYNCLPGTDGTNNALGRYFSVEYMTSTEIFVGVDANYNPGNVVTLSGNLQYNKYINSSKQTTIDALLANSGRNAWYTPGLLLLLRMDVSPADKLSMYLDYRIEGLRYAPTRSDLISGTQSVFCKNLGTIYNMNVGANYNVSRGVGIFLHVNNLLDQRYEGYFGYPVHGFTAMLGGTVSL